MPHKHLDQVLVSDSPKLAAALNDFGDFLKTSYFYPSGSYEKCEDQRVPAAWTKLGRWFEEFVKEFKYFSLIRLTTSTSESAYIELDPDQKAAIIPIKIRSGNDSTDPPQVSWKPLLPGYVTYVNQGFQVMGELDFVLVTT